MENEIWKDIPGYAGIYQVSNYGRESLCLKVILFVTSMLLQQKKKC